MAVVDSKINDESLQKSPIVTTADLSVLKARKSKKKRNPNMFPETARLELASLPACQQVMQSVLPIWTTSP